ncbi:MAG: DNA mismatch repair endonuclease MutL [Balneolales bacterium]
MLYRRFTVNTSIIKALPPEIANKIAAGEVVQRPSSVVKELLDNAVDSGADCIKVIIHNAGRTLIQVIDNGSGMSKDDIPLCFLRHATSKIQTAEDLYHIQTLGFRGEAMASIASVSQVTLTTKRVEDESGFEYEAWGGEVKRFEPAATDNGTSVSVKNLFFNVPARRAFLKTDATEFRHILITFQQVALANHDIGFELIDGTDHIYRIPPQPLNQRIVEFFGKQYKASLIPLEEKTSIVSLKGYIADPKLTKKNRGEQFLFVNGRPFMHRHLSYIIQNIYSKWTRPDEYSFYALYYDIDPKLIDVNVHPAKLEIKFEDERGVATLTRSIVNKAINQSMQVPSMENLSSGDYQGYQRKNSFESGIPGNTGSFSRGSGGSTFLQGNFKSGQDYGTALYDDHKIPKSESADITKPEPKNKRTGEGFWQLHEEFILSQTLSGLCMVDQHAAHKRIIYEKALKASESGLPSTQQLLFPQSVEFSASDFVLLKELKPDMERIGFNLQLLSGNTAMIIGLPADIQVGNERHLLESILQQYQSLSSGMKLSGREKLALALANRSAIRKGKRLTQLEMEDLMDQLFSCDEPYFDPMKKPTILYLPLDEFRSRFS